MHDLVFNSKLAFVFDIPPETSWIIPGNVSSVSLVSLRASFASEVE